jgi:hypothetical protein
MRWPAEGVGSSVGVSVSGNQQVKKAIEEKKDSNFNQSTTTGTGII